MVCASLAGSSSAPLRFVDGEATGFSVTNGFSFTDGRCPAGTVRLDLHELIPSAALGALAFHRGGNGYANDKNVKYGSLAVGALAGGLPQPVPSGGGRGAPCRLASDEPAWQADVRSIPDAMKYKRPQDVPGESNAGSSFLHYGDPGADQGDRHDIHYSYLVWSFVDVRGGGMVRTLLRPGQVVRACDVEPVTMPAWDDDGAVNGSVTARYVRALAGSCPVYGWMVWTHSFAGGPPVAHVKPVAGEPPADPAPDPACPVAAAAAPPTVLTTDSPFAGSVNPQGVPTSYRFDYGVDAAYGGSTAEGALSSSVVAVPVSAAVPEGLAPATTYHYRLVAANTHGTSVGEDRTFVTPAPPPVDRAETVPPPVPAPAVPALRSLRVTPGAFRRARRRRGSPARIRWSLTARAPLTLTFERRVVGERRGGACRTAPRHRRNRHRCARWLRVRASLAVPASAPAVLRFGGWIGPHPLARGAYRLTATPRRGAGKPRHVRFTLR